MRFINNSSGASATCYPKNWFCNTVYRVGLYAKKNLPAGTELFFHYGYQEEKTKNFKEPGAKLPTTNKGKKPDNNGKLIAVKSNSKTTLPSSSSNRRQSSLGSRSLSRRGEKQRTTSKSTNSAGPLQRARKSAPNASFAGPIRALHRSRVRTSDGMDLDEQFISTANEDVLDTSRAPSTDSRVLADLQEVQDPSPDDDYVPEEDHAMNEFGFPDSDEEMDMDDAGEASETLRGRRRERRGGASSVVVVRRGGARSGAGRKRKQTVSSDNDDDDDDWR
jgi:hypothetical protein